LDSLRGPVLVAKGLAFPRLVVPLLVATVGELSS
jgi:hypothetical protein